MKTKETTILEMAKASRSRAVRESLACLILIVILGLELRDVPGGTAAYWGTILLITACGFIAGVVWCFAWTTDMVKHHTADDDGFWLSAFGQQVKLLRTVPLWYIAPIFSGAALRTLPNGPSDLMSFLHSMAELVIIASFLIWLNLSAASSIEKDSRIFQVER